MKPDKPKPFPQLNLPDPDPGSNDDLPDEDGPYNEDDRKPIWWYHTDHLGSSTYLTDNFGRPSHYYETLPFGEMIVEHNQSANNGVGYDNKYKFNGKELDDATGMYYYGARYYDPRISIFVSVDPLAEQFQGWTPYHYVHQNPINLIDPTGMSAEGLSPIYGLDGKYLGNDENGFEGEVIFMDEKMYFFLGGRGNIDTNEKGTISHKDAKTFGRTLDQVIGSNPEETFTQAKSDMVNNAITHIVSNMSDAGQYVDQLKNGKSSTMFASEKSKPEHNLDIFRRTSNEGARNWIGEESPGSMHSPTGTFTAQLNTIFRQKGQFTVGNIQNLAAHEILGHFVKGITSRPSDHIRAYDLQMQHPSWNNTTTEWKNIVRGGRELQISRSRR